MAPPLAQLRQAIIEFAADPTDSPLPRALGFTAVKHPANALAAATPFKTEVEGVASAVHRAGYVETAQGSAGLYLVRLRDWGLRSSDRDRARRRIAKAFVRFPLQDSRTLIALLPPEWKDAKQRDVEFVVPKLRQKGDIATVRALVNAADPSGFHVRVLQDLALADGMDLAAISRHWADAFSVERVTTAFYKEFEKLRDRMVATIQAKNKKHPLLGGADQLAAVNRLATRQLGRILFVWFLQSKRWLEDDVDYLTKLFDEHCRKGKKNYFRDILLPLFFQALALPKTTRAASVNALLGAVPYLNGGLFTPTDFETELFGGDMERVGDVELPNELFDPRKRKGDVPDGDVSVIGLLASYRFTTRESTPDDMSVDPDPELLGKVFENLNEIQERHDTGTYYTPREIVRFMCRETIDGYLCDEAGVERDLLRRLRQAASDDEPDGGLDAQTRERLDAAIDRVTICDPAVGSGAFLVGAMQELVLLRRGIVHVAERRMPEPHEVAAWKRRIISHNLYGVDINPGAVEICRLRLWLSLVLEEEQPDDEPLPNLDFRILAGDSLIDRVGEISFEDSLGGEVRRLDETLHGMHDDIAQAIAAYQAPKTPKERKNIPRLRKKVIELKRAAMLHQLQYHIDQLTPGVEEQQKRVAEFKKLGATDRALKKEQKVLDAREAQVTQLLNVQTSVMTATTDQAMKPFLWPVEFPEVFDPLDGRAAGFDIVLANPPYVRQEKLDAADQKAYKEAYANVYAGTADLLVFFYARAHQVTRRGGRASFITSDKFMRADYGAGLRSFLASSWTVQDLIDFAHLPVFDADVMPCVVVLQQVPPDGAHQLRYSRLREVMRVSIIASGRPVSVASLRTELENLDALLGETTIAGIEQTTLLEGVWAPTHPILRQLYERLQTGHATFGDAIGSVTSTYGIKTGLNPAFIVGDEIYKDIVESHGDSKSLLRKWYRGEDIHRWRPVWGGKWLVFLPSSSDSASANAWKKCADADAAEDTFRRHHPSLWEHMKEYESYVSKKTGKRVGLRHRSDQGKFWWELRSCTYYAAFERPKMVWKDIAYTPHFAWDDEASYYGNTAFFSAEAPRWLVAICNSVPFLWLSSMTLFEAKDAYYRWLPSDLKDIPIPTPSEDEAAKLTSLAIDADEGEKVANDSEVNDLAFRMYGVDDGERAMIEAWYRLRIRAETVGSVMAHEADDQDDD